MEKKRMCRAIYHFFYIVVNWDNVRSHGFRKWIGPLECFEWIFGLAGPTVILSIYFPFSFANYMYVFHFGSHGHIDVSEWCCIMVDRLNTLYSSIHVVRAIAMPYADNPNGALSNSCELSRRDKGNNCMRLKWKWLVDGFVF